MATFVLDNASVTLNSVNLSDHVQSVTLDITADEIVTTSMGDTFVSRTGGLKDGSLSIEFQQDFAYSGSVLVSSHAPLANGVGELATMSVTFPTSGTITRATS